MSNAMFILTTSSKSVHICHRVHMEICHDRSTGLEPLDAPDARRFMVLETPEPPRIVADDRPAWQTKYGPARRGRR